MDRQQIRSEFQSYFKRHNKEIGIESRKHLFAMQGRLETMAALEEDWRPYTVDLVDSDDDMEQYKNQYGKL